MIRLVFLLTAIIEWVSVFIEWWIPSYKIGGIFSFVLLVIFISKVVLNPAHNVLYLASWLISLSTFGSTWIYQVWQQKGFFFQPISITRFFLIILLLLSLTVVFIYHQALFSYKRTRGNVEKEKLVVEKKKFNLIAFIKKIFGKNKANQDIYLILGEMIEEEK